MTETVYQIVKEMCTWNPRKYAAEPQDCAEHSLSPSCVIREKGNLPVQKHELPYLQKGRPLNQRWPNSLSQSSS